MSMILIDEAELAELKDIVNKVRLAEIKTVVDKIVNLQNGDVKLKCSRCGKDVSTPVPIDTIVRAFIECPECINKRWKDLL